MRRLEEKGRGKGFCPLLPSFFVVAASLFTREGKYGDNELQSVLAAD